MHALTGCDSTSFYKIGMCTVFIGLTGSPDYSELCTLGYSKQIDDVISFAIKFVICLHGKKKTAIVRQFETLDAFRYYLTTTTDIVALQLPPTEDAFRQYASRCHYQFY